MQKGLLHIAGTIRTEQFWPDGESDADTIKVYVGDSEHAFQFRSSPFVDFKPTNVFRTTEVQGIAVKKPINDAKEITIRLQGIDAPELHYTNKQYRQNLAESSTVALANLIKSAGTSPVPCRAFTYVDTPDEVCDVYARVVAEVLIAVNGMEINLNRWLIENGWAFPAFYTSMLPFEIQNCTHAAKRARMMRTGVWSGEFYKTLPLHPEQTFRSGINAADFMLNEDAGTVNFPKLFRRQCAYETKKANGEYTGTFYEYLSTSNDTCYGAKKLLEKGMYVANIKRFADCIDYFTGNLLTEPWNIIFTEKPTTLVGVGEW